MLCATQQSGALPFRLDTNVIVNIPFSFLVSVLSPTLPLGGGGGVGEGLDEKGVLQTVVSHTVSRERQRNLKCNQVYCVCSGP